MVRIPGISCQVRTYVKYTLIEYFNPERIFCRVNVELINGDVKI